MMKNKTIVHEETYERKMSKQPYFAGMRKDIVSSIHDGPIVM